MSSTKQKTDKRVKRYCSLSIPESIHRTIKRNAKKKGQRINEYAPALLKKALKIKKK